VIECGLILEQYEATPYEFGTWTQPTASFANVEYLGTNLLDGKPVNKSTCVKGFDRLS
jgi:lysophospholipase